MSFAIYAIGYLILIGGVAYLAHLMHIPHALHCRDRGDHAGNWRSYRCANHPAQGP